MIALLMFFLLPQYYLSWKDPVVRGGRGLGLDLGVVFVLFLVYVVGAIVFFALVLFDIVAWVRWTVPPALQRSYSGTSERPPSSVTFTFISAPLLLWTEAGIWLAWLGFLFEFLVRLSIRRGFTFWMVGLERAELAPTKL